jgi:aerobic-type carbon monoxide dehydrogenase small subunit (CoxS/CutS family)
MTASGLGGRQVRYGPELLTLVVNGKRCQGIAEPRMLLSDFLRHALGLTGVHVGCEQGVCGACTILLDGELTRSCLLFAVQAEGSEIETIENLGSGDPLHPVQAAFRSEHGLQCGFCTPAMVLAAKRLLEENPNPSEQTIREHLSGQICRCTGYVGIVAAVRKAAATLSEVQGDR